MGVTVREKGWVLLCEGEGGEWGGEWVLHAYDAGRCRK